MTPLPPACETVRRAAETLGLPIEIRILQASSRTAEEAAAACGAPVGAIVKSLVFTGAGSGTPLLLLVSGANRVDEAKVAADIGERIARPDGKTVRALTGFAIGGIPPFGHQTPLKTFIDRDLLDFEIVFAAAGTPSSLFAVSAQALAAATAAQPIAMT